MRSGPAPVCKHHLDLGDGSCVEGRAERGEEGEHLRRRIGLHRVEDAAVRHDAGEGFVVLADDVEVDHEAGAVGSSLVQERADAVGHHRARFPVSKRCSPGVLRRPPPAMETGRKPLDPPTGKTAGWFAPNSPGNGQESGPVSFSLGAGVMPVPHVRQRECVPLQCRRPLEGRQRPKKPATVVALSRPSKPLGDHRHVRIWASGDVCSSRLRRKGKVVHINTHAALLSCLTRARPRRRE